MKTVKFAIIALTMACISQISSFAAEAPKIAVIDVQKVVMSSSQVMELKKSQENKEKELQKFIKNAQADIEKQSSDKNKQTLAEKYEKQFVAKKEANIKEYTTKLKEIDASITAKIGQQAKALGYDMVITKSAVVFGGDDITDAVIKVIK